MAARHSGREQLPLRLGVPVGRPNSSWRRAAIALVTLGSFLLCAAWIAQESTLATFPWVEVLLRPSLAADGGWPSARPLDGMGPSPACAPCTCDAVQVPLLAPAPSLESVIAGFAAAAPQSVPTQDGLARADEVLDPALAAADDVGDEDWPRVEELVPDVSGEEEEMKSQIASTAEWLLQEWAQSSMLRGRNGTNLTRTGSPLPPHLQDCLTLEMARRQLDERGPGGAWPPWPLFGGTSAVELQLSPDEAAPKELLSEGGTGSSPQHQDLSESFLGSQPSSSVMGPLPPWVMGADEDNLVLTRRVQRDLWLLQHPRDCHAPHVRFLIVNIAMKQFKGVGSFLKNVACFLQQAVNLQRVLVIRYFIKTDHDLCRGPLRGTWSCYFVRETSRACHERAMVAISRGEGVMEGRPGWEEAVFVQGERLDWRCSSPDLWGTPWLHNHPTVQVNGVLLGNTADNSHRWFEAQAMRYLMRWPSTRLCLLTNRARHNSFGRDAALVVARSLVRRKANNVPPRARLEHPLKPFWDRGSLFMEGGRMISMHVRQGDKKGEMTIHNFTDYMALAEVVRDRFPEASNVWLSTEMHSVVKESEGYKGWRFFYTNITRQGQLGESMEHYEGDLGSVLLDNTFVNLMISVQCDYFVGTMGSTWSIIIDDLRRTSGKEQEGLLTVNKDRAWRV